MKRTDATENGVIEEVLPNLLFRVRLADGREVVAGLAPAARHSTVRLISGSRVRLKLMAHDPNRGQIIEQVRGQS